MSIRFDHPELLWLLLLAAPIVWLGMRSLATLEPHRRYTAIALRLAVLLVLVLMLAGLQAVRTHGDLTTIAVVDQSESVRRFGQPPASFPSGPGSTVETWIADYLQRAAADRRQNDRFGMVTFDGRSSVRSLPSEAVTLDPGAIERPIEGTDVAAGIRSAMALYPPDTGSRMLLVSDGNSTAGDGDVLAAAREAAAANIPIDVVPVRFRVGEEVMVEALYAPTEAREGQTIPLRVVLRATAPSAGAVQLLHDGEPVDLNGRAEGVGAPVRREDWSVEAEASRGEETGGRYVAVKQVDLPLRYTGASRFVAIYEPANAQSDAMSVNNQAEAFTLVQGKGRLLFVNGVEGESGAILPSALASRGIELDVVDQAGVPSTISALQRYDAVVLQNVAADYVSGPQQRLLAQYVNNLGGGLVMIGGPDGFGAGGWTNSPIDDILPVECEIPSQTILPSGALVLVIDRSGSMEEPVGGSSRNKLDLAVEAASLAVGTLFPQDLVGVVAFDDLASWVVELQPNSDARSVIRLIRSIQPGGGTNIYAGLQLAQQRVQAMTMQEAAVRHVILLTDGMSDEPAPGAYNKLAAEMIASGVTLSTIGVGDGHDKALLARLAAIGGGQYHGITDPDRLPQVFIKEAKTIRKNLIREGVFTPQPAQFSPVLAGLDPPELRGFVRTGEKRHPLVTTALLGPEDEPIFAHWQVGLGRTAAFTSDATNRWGTPWLQWPGYVDFWTRTMRMIARPAATREADLIATVEGDRLRVRLDVAGSGTGTNGGRGEGAFANFLRVRGSVILPDGNAQDVELSQTGPGLYETQTPATQTGNYIVTLFTEDPQSGERRTVFGGASRAPGRELRRFTPNLPLLQQVAEITGGRFVDPMVGDPPGLFERTRPFETRSVRPLWRTLVPWLLALLLLDVACRRIAWDPVAMRRWAADRFKAAGPAGDDEKAAATLAGLKRKRGEVAAAQPTEVAPEAVAALRPPPRKRRKFEAGKDYQAAGDLAAAVGGAQADRPAPQAEPAKPQAAEEGGDGPMTSRLLAAKKRTQQKLEDDDS